MFYEDMLEKQNVEIRAIEKKSGKRRKSGLIMGMG